jgi:hypothetical protein
MKVADLNGKQAITFKAQVLGEVEGVEIDISEWKRAQPCTCLNELLIMLAHLFRFVGLCLYLYTHA